MKASLKEPTRFVVRTRVVWQLSMARRMAMADTPEARLVLVGAWSSFLSIHIRFIIQRDSDPQLGTLKVKNAPGFCPNAICR